MNVYEERPKLGQLVVFDNELWLVIGYRFDPYFIDIECINDRCRTYTYPFVKMQVLEISIEDVPDIKDLSMLMIEYPEYLI